MWEGEDKGPRSQEETPHADQTRTVHPAAKVADKDDEDGVADLQREQRSRVRPEALSSPTHRVDLTVTAERQEAAWCRPRAQAEQWCQLCREGQACSFSFPLLSETLPSLSLLDQTKRSI